MHIANVPPFALWGSDFARWDRAFAAATSAGLRARVVWKSYTIDRYQRNQRLTDEGATALSALNLSVATLFDARAISKTFNASTDYWDDQHLGLDANHRLNAALHTKLFGAMPSRETRERCIGRPESTPEGLHQKQ